MITQGIFQKAHLGDLKKALDVYANRHKVVADNIANVQTEGYGAQSFRFEEYLSEADMKLTGARTHSSHLHLGRRQLESTHGDIADTQSSYDNGINNVDIDKEMTDLATNDLSYRLTTRLLSMKYANLRSAIRGRSV